MSLIRILLYVIIGSFFLEVFFKVDMSNKIRHIASESWNLIEEKTMHLDSADTAIYSEISEVKIEKIELVKEAELIKEVELVEATPIDSNMLECIKRSSYSDRTEYDKIISLYCIDLPIKDASLISSMPNLERLEIIKSEINSINLTSNPKLKYLNLSKNNINEIDLSKNIELQYLDLSSNQLKCMDLSFNKNIKYLLIFKNKLECVNLDGLLNINYIYANDNKLVNIELPNSKSFESLYLYNNKLNNLIGLQNLASLKVLEVFGNDLDSLNLTFNPNLMFLTIQDNPIRQVLLDENHTLDQIWAWDTKLSIDNLIQLRAHAKNFEEGVNQDIDYDYFRRLSTSKPAKSHLTPSKSYSLSDCKDQEVNELKQYLSKRTATVEGARQYIERGVDLNPSKCSTPLDVIYTAHLGSEGELIAYLYKNGARSKYIKQGQYGNGAPFINFSVRDKELFIMLIKDGIDFKRSFKREMPFDAALRRADDFTVRLIYQLGGHYKYEPDNFGLKKGFEIPHTLNRKYLYGFFKSTGELASINSTNHRNINKIFRDSVLNNNLKVMNELLTKGAKVNFSWWQEIGDISLIESISKSGDTSMVKHLIELGADIPNPDSYWLDWGINTSEREGKLIKFFNEELKKKELNRGNISRTLNYAILVNEWNRVDELLKHDLAFNNQRVLNSALNFSILENNNKLSERILSYNSFKLNNNYFNVPLSKAMATENLELMQILLKKGVSINTPEELGHGDQGNSAIEAAIDHKNGALLEVIVDFYPTYNAAKLFRAIRKENELEAIKWFNRYSSNDLTLSLSQFGSVLLQSVWKDNVKLASKILSYPEGLKLIEKKHYGSSVLINSKSEEMSALLIKHGSTYFRYSQGLSNILHNQIHNNKYDNARVTMSVLPKDGYTNGFFDKHLKRLKKQGEKTLYNELSEKVSELELVSILKDH
jgi:Leucine-rich repeat (LRR) protein